MPAGPHRRIALASLAVFIAGAACHASEALAWRAVATADGRIAAPAHAPRLACEAGGFAVAFESETGALALSRQIPGAPEQRVRLRAMPQTGAAALEITAHPEAGAVALEPAAALTVEIEGAFAYAVAATFIGDDLVYCPDRAGDLDVLHVPAQHLLLGLLEGGAGMAVLAWQGSPGAAKLRVAPRGARFSALRTPAQSTPVLAGLLAADGLWHAEPAPESWYERDAALDWTPPFPAKWSTQLSYQRYAADNWQNPAPYTSHEGQVTTFAFPPAKPKGWRQTVGWFPGPCWLDGDCAMVHIGQKVLPAAPEILVYALERNDGAPPGVQTPRDLLDAVWGPDHTGETLDLAGRAPLDVHRPASKFRQPVCETLDALAPVFAQGRDDEQADLVTHVAEDIRFYCARVVERIEHFAGFPQAAAAFQKDRAPCRDFLASLDVARAADTIEGACSLPLVADALDDLAEPLDAIAALAHNGQANDHAAFRRHAAAIMNRVELLDTFVSQCDFLLRGLAQRAGYRCADAPEKTRCALDLRALIAAYLRNPTYLELCR